MAIVEIINPSQFNPVEYKSGDESTILPIGVNANFTTQGGRAEALVYDLQGNLLSYNSNAKFGITGNGASGDLSGGDKLDLYPEEEVKNNGVTVGTYNVFYNIFNNELNSSEDAPFSLKQISADRKEVRLTTSFLAEEELREAVNQLSPSELVSPYYPDYYLNFGVNRISIVTNLIFDDSNNQYSVLLKLYEPLPSFASESDACWIATKQRDSIAYQVTLEAPKPLPTPRKNVLKGPNFSLPVNNQVHSTVKLTNLEELQNLSGILTGSRRQIDYVLNKKGVTVDVDYHKFDNFVHFSSAEKRVDNFVSKLGLIEHLSASIYTSSYTSTAASSSRFNLEKRISDTISSFDGFEHWMYYTSESNVAPYPKPWPKSTSTKPYTLVTTGSGAASIWKTRIKTSASLYDNQNQNNLTNTIPEYLLEDPDNAPYTKFVEMVGQHFDTLFVYIQDITNRYDGDNRLDFGISKDLVGEAIKSMGINLYTGNFTAYDLAESLAGIRVPSTGSDGQTNITTYKTASSDPVPVEDVNKEIYKRIYHNLPLLTRQKGSLAGLRTLITCFGIPEEILKIREFDIKGKSDIWDLPDVNTSSSITYDTIIPEFPPSRSFSPPPKFLSPIIRVQQDYVSQSNYDRSLQYVEVGFSPSTYLDETDHATFNPLGSDFPDFNDFYFGSNINYYGSKFVGGDSAATQTVTWNTGAFIRYIKFLDSSLFNMIKDFTPVRSSTATGVIIKPTIKERQRQRPAQLQGEDFRITNLTGSAITEEHDLDLGGTNTSHVIRSIGDYASRFGSPGLEVEANKPASYRYPAGPGGSTNNLNRYTFGEGTDWAKYDIKTPVSGMSQVWTEKIFYIQSYAEAALGYPSSSAAVYSTNYTTIHNGQQELYNGIFQQLERGIGNFDNYLDRELALDSSANEGAGVIRTDNNRFNPYKVAVNNKFPGLSLDVVTTFPDFLNSTGAIIYNPIASVIYIKITGTVTEDLLRANGDQLVFEVGGTNVAFSVGGTPSKVSNATADYIAFAVIDNPTLNENVFIAADGSNIIYVANLVIDGNPYQVLSPWGSSEYNPLIGNSFDPSAGLTNYAGIRKSQFFLDIDYSPSAPSSINPINLPVSMSQSIFFGSASFAAVQDSNYASKWWKSMRYDGVRRTSLDFNSTILKAVDNISAVFTSESLGIDPDISASAPQPPILPVDAQNK